MEKKLVQIIRQFPPAGKDIRKIEAFGSGHINDTYKVLTDNGKFILQRINHQIFTDVEGLTENILKITRYIEKKNKESQIKIPQLFSTHSGKFLFKDDQSNYWRLMSFIENSRSFDRVLHKEIAFEGGKAYGWFVRSLSGFPAAELVESIPLFHHIDFRLQNLEAALKNDAANRAGSLQTEIDFVYKRAEEMRKILQLGTAGKIPLRVTHNDTKINNVLFNNNNKAISVVDLDTVMPGYVHYDFGDAIRTFTNTAAEDEPDLSKVGFNMAYFKAFAQGFLSQTKDVLNPVEINNLAFSARLMTYIIGLRFLTDYINGDTYFKTAYDTHNLIRARAQFRLLETMEAKSGAMEKFILSL